MALSDVIGAADEWLAWAQASLQRGDFGADSQQSPDGVLLEQDRQDNAPKGEESIATLPLGIARPRLPGAKVYQFNQYKLRWAGWGRPQYARKQRLRVAGASVRRLSLAPAIVGWRIDVRWETRATICPECGETLCDCWFLG